MNLGLFWYKKGHQGIGQKAHTQIIFVGLILHFDAKQSFVKTRHKVDYLSGLTLWVTKWECLLNILHFHRKTKGNGHEILFVV